MMKEIIITTIYYYYVYKKDGHVMLCRCYWGLLFAYCLSKKEEKRKEKNPVRGRIKR